MVSFSFLLGCIPSKKNIIGVYVASSKKNSIDSLFLYNDNSYKHSIYSYEGERKIYTQYGDWEYKDGFIDLKEFYDNDDQFFKENINYNFAKNTIWVNTPVNKYLSEITIDINSDMGNFYEKVEHQLAPE